MDASLLRELERSQTELARRIKNRTRLLRFYAFLAYTQVGAMIGSILERAWGKAAIYGLLSAGLIATFLVLRQSRAVLRNLHESGEKLVQEVSTATGVQLRLPEPSESEMRRIRKRLERDLREMSHER